MSKVKIVMNNDGMQQLLKSPEMIGLCTELAEQARARCGPGYEVNPYIAKKRVKVSIYPATPEARKDNFDHNTMLKAVYGGGGRDYEPD